MISVVIPTFNRGSFLKKAIESVLNQTYQDFELIIVDDGSADATESLVRSFSNRIKYIKQDNRGPASARNLGIKHSKGEFIAFLDSDDWWHREKLKLQIEKMQENPQYLISHTQEVWYKNSLVFNQRQRHKKFHGYIFDKCLRLCCVSLSTVMVRREFFDKEGLFDEGLVCCEDYDLWLRASVNHEFFLIDEALTLKDGGRRDQLSFIYGTGIDKFRIRSIMKLLEGNHLTNGQRRLAVQELQKKCRIYGNGCIKHGKREEGECYLIIRDRY